MPAGSARQGGVSSGKSNVFSCFRSGAGLGPVWVEGNTQQSRVWSPGRMSAGKTEPGSEAAGAAASRRRVAGRGEAACVRARGYVASDFLILISHRSSLLGN